MNLKISISKIFEYFVFLYPHLAFACMWWRGSGGDDHEISSYLHSKRYQNINLDQIKNRDINMMITYLIFNQNCNFLATHVDARSWNCDFLLSSVDSSRCPAKWQTRFWKLKLKSNKLGIYETFIRILLCLNLNFLSFEADSEYELENIDFQNFWIFCSPLPTPCICMHVVERQQGRRSWNFIIFALKKISEF